MQANQGCRQKELQRGMQSLCSRGVNLQPPCKGSDGDGDNGEGGEDGDDTDTDRCRW